MSTGESGNLFKKNWYLFAILAATLAAAAGVAYFGAGDAQNGDSADVPDEVIAGLRLDENPGPFHPAQTAQDRASEAIQQYESEFAADPDAPDTGIRLFRLGNLYFQGMGNFEKAAQYYELLIQRYPNHEKVPIVYPLLSTCYEQMGKPELAREIYRRMLEYFEPDTNEYAFAERKLNDPSYQPGR